MKTFVKDRIDLYTEEGVYLFSVMKGRDTKWRHVRMYQDTQGIERIHNVNMETPDYQNTLHMNLKECPFCKGRSSTCEDCCGSGWTHDV